MSRRISYARHKNKNNFDSGYQTGKYRNNNRKLHSFHWGGGEQTSSYKVLNTYPIIGGILDKLAFIRTHAAAVWYNKLAKRTVKDEIDDLKRKIDVMPFIENLELKANVAHEITSDKKLNSVIYFFGRHRDIWLTGVGITNTAGTIYLSPNVSVSYRYNTTSKVWTFNANSDMG